jgi:hypothetical protein
MLDRPTADKFDSREINRKAVASWVDRLSHAR